MGSQIEGDWYCPSIPESLREATRDYRNHVIDEDTYHRRLTERWKYVARPRASLTPRATCGCSARPPAPGRWRGAHSSQNR